jgi:hypothetical protein
MNHISRHIASGLATAGAVAFLLGTASLPAAAQPICDCANTAPTTPATVVVKEIEVPVDDRGTEITQMGLAAALGAMLTGGTALALRRRSQRGAPRTPAGAS